MNFEQDPIGCAICDYHANGFTENITVSADLCEDDIMPVEYLFRPEEIMPEIEIKAMELCKGTVLDVGAAAGCHSLILQSRGFDVQAIDTSKGAVTYLKESGINATHIDFLACEGKYDTLLLLMNGIGIAGKLSLLPAFLRKIKSLLSTDGQAICDSTDLTYLYQEDDGSMWVDLNSQYFGEMQFKMQYKTVSSEWFDWLYIEFDLLKDYAEKEGLSCEMIMEGPSHNYLVRLKHL